MFFCCAASVTGAEFWLTSSVLGTVEKCLEYRQYYQLNLLVIRLSLISVIRCVHVVVFHPAVTLCGWQDIQIKLLTNVPPHPPPTPWQSHQRKGETIWSLWKGRSSWSWTGSFLVMLELSASISSMWCVWSLERPCSWRPTCPTPTCLEVRTLSPASGTCAHSLCLPNSPIQASLFVAVELAQKWFFSSSLTQFYPLSKPYFVHLCSFFKLYCIHLCPFSKHLSHSVCPFPILPPAPPRPPPVWLYPFSNPLLHLPLAYSTLTIFPTPGLLTLSIFPTPGLFSFIHFPHPWLIDFIHFPHPWLIQLYPFSPPLAYWLYPFPHPWLIDFIHFPPPLAYSALSIFPTPGLLTLSIFPTPGLFSFIHFPHPWFIGFIHFPHPWLIDFIHFPHPWLIDFIHFPHPWLIQL